MKNFVKLLFISLTLVSSTGADSILKSRDTSLASEPDFTNGDLLMGRGCCSHHGGQSHCSKSGRWVCMDGTFSPTCRCR
jgi:hypothetical protein